MARPYQKLVFVCVHGRSCPRQGSLDTCNALRQEVTRAGLRDKIRIVKSGCLAQCGHGPMVAIEPDGAWYCKVTESDAARLLEGPILSDTLITELHYQPPTNGKNVLPEDRWPIPPLPQES